MKLHGEKSRVHLITAMDRDSEIPQPQQMSKNIGSGLLSV